MATLLLCAVQAHRFVVMSAYLTAVHDLARSLAVAALESALRCYTRLHNYGLHVTTATNESLPYAHYVKIRSLQHIFATQPQTTWALWLDADVRILNYSFRLEDLVHKADDVHLFAISQWEGFTLADSRWPHCPIINFGFMLRNSAVGRRFLDLWAELALRRHESPQFDQFGFCYAMAALLTDHSRSALLHATLHHYPKDRSIRSLLALLTQHS